MTRQGRAATGASRPGHWWGMLRVLGVEEIPEDFAWSNEELRREITRLRTRLQNADKLAEQKRLDPAVEVIRGVVDEAGRSADLAAIHTETACQLEQIEQQRQRTRQEQLNEEGRRLWEQFGAVLKAPYKEGGFLVAKMTAFAQSSSLAEDERQPLVEAAADALEQKKTEEHQARVDRLLRRIRECLNAEAYDDAEGLTRQLQTVGGPAAGDLCERLFKLAETGRLDKAFAEGLDAIDKDPERRRIECLARLRQEIEGMSIQQRYDLAETADDWICQQIDALLADPGPAPGGAAAS